MNCPPSPWTILADLVGFLIFSTRHNGIDISWPLKFVRFRRILLGWNLGARPFLRPSQEKRVFQSLTQLDRCIWWHTPSHQIPPQQRLRHFLCVCDVSRNVEKSREISRSVDNCRGLKISDMRRIEKISNDFDITRRNATVEKFREISKNVEFCQIFSKSLLGT